MRRGEPGLFSFEYSIDTKFLPLHGAVISTGMYVCFPLLIFRSEMFPSRRRYHLTTICPRDTYGSHLGLTWLSPKNII